MNDPIKEPIIGDSIRIKLPKEATEIFRQKGGMSPQELEALLKAYKPQEIRQYPNASLLGVQDAVVVIDNFQAIDTHIKKAFKDGYYIEVVSFILQYIDYDLRLYYAYHSKKKVNPNHAFGDLINLCENFSFDPVLAQEIREFNDLRIKIIHRFFLGEVTLEGIRLEIEKYKNFHIKVGEYVNENSGDLI